MADFVAFYGAHGFWVWTALAAALLAVEVVSGTGWLLSPATSAGVVAVLAALTPVTTPTALAISAVLTIVTTFLARRYLPRPLRSARPRYQRQHRPARRA